MRASTRLILGRFLIVNVLLTIGITTRGEEPADKPVPDEQAKQLAARRLEFMLKSVRDFQVVPDDDPMARWQLYSQPLLRWSNPVGGVPDGVLLMWTDGKRPAIFAQVFPTKDGYWIHEFQSAALKPFAMRDSDRVLWQPRQAAGEFQSIDGAAAPAESKVKRLAQMRALARDFAAFDDFKIKATDRETTRHELRLMSNPLYRYDAEQQNVIDGAVFAFTLGTDPELLVVLEARETPDGAKTWEYALAAMTCWAVEVKHRDRSVWRIGERLQNHTPRDGYHSWVFARERVEAN